MGILAHKNNWQKSPVSAIPVVVAFAQAATRHGDAQDEGDGQKSADKGPVDRKVGCLHLHLQERRVKSPHRIVNSPSLATRFFDYLAGCFVNRLSGLGIRTDPIFRLSQALKARSGARGKYRA